MVLNIFATFYRLWVAPRGILNDAVADLDVIPHLLPSRSSPTLIRRQKVLQNTTFQWENTLGQTFPYNGGTLNVASTEPGTVGYFLSGSACGASLGGVSATTWITGVSTQVNSTGVDDICSAGRISEQYSV